jgi:peptidoglycan/xylan/chitin deacetylase (PgdA/CDA1 family)
VLDFATPFRCATVKLALKIDVDTYRGTREGVPRLVDILARHGAKATFLFSLGPDHTGLLHRTVLPAPDIGQRCADILRGVRDEEFEVGIHAWDFARWRGGVGKAKAGWTREAMDMAARRFLDVFHDAARMHGAAAWQMNVHAFRHTQVLGFDYCSDTRGTHPFIPVVRAEIVACPQFPTTLPTLDEVSGQEEKILESTAREPRDHVFTLRAELEGMRLAPAFERLLEGWKAQGYELVSLRTLASGYPVNTLPLHTVVDSPIPGRSGTVATQGPEFLPET